MRESNLALRGRQLAVVGRSETHRTDGFQKGNVKRPVETERGPDCKTAG